MPFASDGQDVDRLQLEKLNQFFFSKFFLARASQKLIKMSSSWCSSVFHFI